MISYKGIKKTYVSDRDIIKDLISYLESNNFYDPNKEAALLLGEKINAFLDSFRCEEREEVLERNETEEEAKAFFGEEFVSFYTELIRRIDNSNAILAIHGTSESLVSDIMQEGLRYKAPALLSTAVLQDMPFGDEAFAVSNFSELLNWRHRGHKYLALVAVPYESFYKEGLWEHTHESTSEYDLCYRIPLDFLIGYIDVNKKTIIMNPTYKRSHDYSSLVPDMEVYRENPDLTPEIIRESSKAVASDASQSPRFKCEVANEVLVNEDNYIDLLGGAAEDIRGILNAIYYGHEDGISEAYYRENIRYFKKLLSILSKSQKYLLSKAEIERIRKEEEERFKALLAASPQGDEWGEYFDWNSDVTWDEDPKRG